MEEQNTGGVGRWERRGWIWTGKGPRERNSLWGAVGVGEQAPVVKELVIFDFLCAATENPQRYPRGQVKVCLREGRWSPKPVAGWRERRGEEGGQFKGQVFEACTRAVLIHGRRDESGGSVGRTCDQRLSIY